MVMLIASLVLFWFITVFVVQDHNLDILTGVLWSIIAFASATIVVHLLRLAHIFEEDPLLLLLVAAAVQGLVLLYALRFRFYVTRASQIATILGLYYATFIVLGLVSS